MFHEPFVMFGYLAALTEKIEFCTGIIILPQRQTALVAKQTAEVDVLTNGRLRLGIGVGWNEVEFEALGENWENRGRRSAEQVEVMRMLWTQEVVNYEGRYHIRSPTPASTPCRYSDPFRSGSEGARPRWCGASPGWATVGSRSSSPTAPAGSAWRRCAKLARGLRTVTLPPSASRAAPPWPTATTPTTGTSLPPTGVTPAPPTSP